MTRGPGRPEIGRPVNVRFSDDLLAAIDGRAEMDGCSRAELIRRAVRDWLTVQFTAEHAPR